MPTMQIVPGTTVGVDLGDRKSALCRLDAAGKYRIDAQYLARQGRADPKLVYPIRHRGEAAQADLVLISSRDCLVRCRTLLINHVRGVVKSFGE